MLLRLFIVRDRVSVQVLRDSSKAVLRWQNIGKS